MKKIFAIVAFAAICITASAQELVTYTGSEFIVQHPAEFKGEEDIWGLVLTNGKWTIIIF